MNFKNVVLELYGDGFEITTEDGGTTLARFREAFDFSKVDVPIEANCLTVYDKSGETLVSFVDLIEVHEAELYKNKQEPGEE